ncbi:hypothetical protein AXF42_Ash008171 [Apostasia shenzhenica]|uniref:Cystatin domain-containing protein n=1 Tax=Apostasia shenzhenica TaxID=1088818 RepID=A0A2I0A8T5_9ASPA|nr:hypothetical protein AXF42_Ash008171 [Apostasia shenzhenica]
MNINSHQVIPISQALPAKSSPPMTTPSGHLLLLVLPLLLIFSATHADDASADGWTDVPLSSQTDGVIQSFGQAAFEVMQKEKMAPRSLRFCRVAAFEVKVHDNGVLYAATVMAKKYPCMRNTPSCDPRMEAYRAVVAGYSANSLQPLSLTLRAEYNGNTSQGMCVV